jgi:hypothetical protein
MGFPNREGKTYRHRMNNAIVVVVRSRRMSAGTARHTVVVIDPGNAMTSGRARLGGEQVEIDEVPVSPWERMWEEV